MKEEIEDGERFIFHMGFTCKCNNRDASKFLLSRWEDSPTYMELMCVVCERKYKTQVISEEIPI